MSGNKPDISVDFSKGIEVDGQMLFPLSHPSAINPCAGKSNGTPCEYGGICRDGQCLYSPQRLKELGIKVPDL
jgi:hypothetical protein